MTRIPAERHEPSSKDAGIGSGEVMARAAKVLLNVPAIKKDFPILARTVRDKPLTYLDSTATSQKPKQVIDAIVDYYARYNANVHRAIYELGEESTRAYEGARERIAEFIHAKSPMEIAFTKSTTESLNLIAYGWGLKGHLKEGDEVVGTVMEHHSNHVPWHFVRDLKGAVLKYVDVDDDGELRMEQYDDLITKRTKVVTVAHVSNVLGTINDVKEIAKRAHEVGAICVVDAAQSVPHMPVDVQDLGCDFLAFSGHKMLGPTGIGILYGTSKILEETEPLLGGGEMIREVHLGTAKWNDVPYKFEGGTPNIEGAIGLGAAVDYLAGIGMDSVRAHEIELTAYALKRLAAVEGLRVYGPRDPARRGGVVSFTMEKAHPHDIASILDVEGVCIRSGHHCAQPLMDRFHLAATARASFYVYNDVEDVDRLVAALEKVHEVFA